MQLKVYWLFPQRNSLWVFRTLYKITIKQWAQNTNEVDSIENNQMCCENGYQMRQIRQHFSDVATNLFVGFIFQPQKSVDKKLKKMAHYLCDIIVACRSIFRDSVFIWGISLYFFFITNIKQFFDLQAPKKCFSFYLSLHLYLPSIRLFLWLSRCRAIITCQNKKKYIVYFFLFANIYFHLFTLPQTL